MNGSRGTVCEAQPFVSLQSHNPTLSKLLYFFILFILEISLIDLSGEVNAFNPNLSNLNTSRLINNDKLDLLCLWKV